MNNEALQAVKITKDELLRIGADTNSALNSQQLNVLLGKTPKSQILTRQAKGGGEWKFVTGTYVKKVLNMVFGWNWDFEIVEHKFDLQLKQAYVLGRLKVRSNGMEIVKMQFGRVDIKFKKADGLPLDIGNDLKAAATDALKKCASELGIASDVYAPNEFKEVKIYDTRADIESEQETVRGQIIKLLEQKKSLLSDMDIEAIHDILTNNDVNSFYKVLTTLKNIK